MLTHPNFRRVFFSLYFALLALLVNTSSSLASGYWFDLLTEDTAKARSFYRDLFGWQFEQLSSGYWLVLHEGRPLGGMDQIDNQVDGVSESLWLVALPVANLDEAVSRAQAADATLHQAADTAPILGRFAVMIDPQGAPFTLRQSSSTPAASGAAGTWAWAELWTDDPAAAGQFYAALTDSRSVNASNSGEPYQVLTRHGRPWAGYLRAPFQEVKSIWLPYLNVDDINAVTALAARLGGSVLIAPQEDLHGGQIALLLDPTGAAFLVLDETP